MFLSTADTLACLPVRPTQSNPIQPPPTLPLSFSPDLSRPQPTPTPTPTPAPSRTSQPSPHPNTFQAIARKGRYGAFLLREPNLVAELVARLVQELDVPVTVKMRVLESGSIDDTVWARQGGRVGGGLRKAYDRRFRGNKGDGVGNGGGQGMRTVTVVNTNTTRRLKRPPLLFHFISRNGDPSPAALHMPWHGVSAVIRWRLRACSSHAESPR